jgi:hypothetical protein
MVVLRAAWMPIKHVQSFYDVDLDTETMGVSGLF